MNGPRYQETTVRYDDNSRSPEEYEENQGTLKSFNGNEASMADPFLNLSQLDPRDL
jgi:hypothetical protein